jgi:hypothetical protein
VARLTLTLALFLAIAAPAHAAGTQFASGVDPLLAGPVPAGDRVAWATQSPEGVDVQVAGRDGSARTLHRIPAALGVPGTRAFLAFAASERRTATALYVQFCDLPCKYQWYEPRYRGTLTAPLGDRPARLDGDCRATEDWNPAVDVWGDVVAHDDACAKQTVVRDLGAPPGEPAVFTYPPGEALRLAGPYLAIREGAARNQVGDGALVVREWRTGAERLRIPGKHDDVRLQPDGKVAFVRRQGNSTDLVWASPEQPEPRVIAAGEDGPVVGLVDDVVAYGEQRSLILRRLDGELVGSAPGATDFDGRRFTGVARPCAVAFVATWALGDERPQPPAGACPLAGSRREVLRSYREPPGSRAADARLACPADVVLGCGGFARLVAPHRRTRRAVALGGGAFALMPGATGEVRLYLERPALCAAGRNALRPVLEIVATRRSDAGPDRTKRRRVRLTGIERTLAKCEGRT